MPEELPEGWMDGQPIVKCCLVNWLGLARGRSGRKEIASRWFDGGSPDFACSHLFAS